MKKVLKKAVPDNYLDCGNSGSVAYFATPMAALADGYTFVTGDAQIRRRPIDETLSAIRELGGFAEPSRPGSTSCPAVIHGIMKGGTAHFDGKLSQIVSGIMMAAPCWNRIRILSSAIRRRSHTWTSRWTGWHGMASPWKTMRTIPISISRATRNTAASRPPFPVTGPVLRFHWLPVLSPVPKLSSTP